MHPPQIIGPDQHDRCFGRNARHLPVADAPDQAGSGIALEPEVDGVPVAIEPLPDRSEILPVRRTRLLPVLCDRIAQKDQFGLRLCDFAQFLLMPLPPPGQVGARNRRGGRDGARLAGAGQAAIAARAETIQRRVAMYGECVPIEVPAAAAVVGDW